MTMIDRIDELFRQQRKAWPLLATGLSGLTEAKARPVQAAGSEVLVRHIPHRVASTTAAVDRESIRRRPCFLCPENLDPAEKGLAFGATHTMYCNPFPVLERHITVVHRDHRPQRIDGQLGTMLDLAKELPKFFVVYNGPECGASAPDHAHLQAGWREGLPLVRDVEGRTGTAIGLYGARALLFRGEDRLRLLDEIARSLAILSSVTGRTPEPLCNTAVFHEPQSGWTVVVFPRGKHRPDTFYTGELTMSPAAIDLCGILVAPVARDFERITGEEVEAVFREVTLPEASFRELVARLESGR
jgi:Domain of unknown function (DUF4922)